LANETVPAVVILETMKPLATVGGGILRMTVAPFVFAFWGGGHALLDTFEDKRNIEKLIRMFEEKNEQERKAKAAEKAKQPKKEKTGWRKYLPF
jgi:hypothetical protein